MRFPRVFTRGMSSPFADQTYESRVSEIREPNGKVVFHQDNVQVPSDWSQVATDILAQKYFRRTQVPDALSFGGGGRARTQKKRGAGLTAIFTPKFYLPKRFTWPRIITRNICCKTRPAFGAIFWRYTGII